MEGHGPYILIDGHTVIIQNHDQRFSGRPCIIQPFVGQPSGQSAVADQGQHAVILSPQSSRPRHPQGHGNGVGRMARYKSVMYTLIGLWKSRQAVQLPQGGELLPPARQNLMDVALMSHIEHQPVPFSVKNPMDGNSQLHRAQIGGQMSTCFRYAPHKKLPQLLTELGKLSGRQGTDVRGGMDGFQQQSASSSQRWNRCRNRPAQ